MICTETDHDTDRFYYISSTVRSFIGRATPSQLEHINFESSGASEGGTRLAHTHCFLVQPGQITRLSLQKRCHDTWSILTLAFLVTVLAACRVPWFLKFWWTDLVIKNTDSASLASPSCSWSFLFRLIFFPFPVFSFSPACFDLPRRLFLERARKAWCAFHRHPVICFVQTVIYAISWNTRNSMVSLGYILFQVSPWGMMMHWVADMSGWRE